MKNQHYINEIEKEKEKLIKKRIYIRKFKDDWDNQTKNKLPDIEMDRIEKQIKKNYSIK